MIVPYKELFPEVLPLQDIAMNTGASILDPSFTPLLSMLPAELAVFTAEP